MTSHIVNIAIGADHRGYALKEEFKRITIFGALQVVWHDRGAFSSERSDYPIFAHAVARAVVDNHAQLGVLLCGTGVGMAITANRYKNIYAALVWNEEIARLSKEDDNANVLVLPADFIDFEQGVAMISAWLQASFKEGRYHKRLELIDNIL